VRVVALYRHWRHRRLIRRLRGNLAFFGLDTSGMSDEEVERRVTEACLVLGRVARAAAVTAEDAARALTAAGRMMRGEPACE
jgi:hypothetical protein